MEFDVDGNKDGDGDCICQYVEISGSVFVPPFFKYVGIQCLPSIVLILLVFHVSTVSSF